MKLYLLRHYTKPSFDISQNRVLIMMMGMALPVVLINAWIFPNAWGVWSAAVLSLIGILVIPQRPTPFEAALPISGRDIALVRSIMAFSTFVSPVVLAAVVVKVVHKGAFPLYELAQASAIVALAVLLPRLVKPSEFSVPAPDTMYPILPMGVVAGLMIFYLGNLASLLLLVLAAVLAAMMWWRVVPNAFEAAPRKVDARGNTRDDVATADVANSRAWWRIVVSTLWTKNRMFLTICLVVFGTFGNWQLFALMMLQVEELWQRPRWMQSLPISYRARLWMILIPGVFLPMTAAVVGTRIHVPHYDYMQGLHRGAVQTYKQEPGYFNSPTSVSLEYWEIANASVPLITAPWGETAQPYLVRMFNRVYYNPYSARKASSERFARWQFERLTTAVYGYPLPFKEYEDGQLNPRRLTQSLRMTVLNIATALVFAFAFLIGSGWARWRGAWRHQQLVGSFNVLLMLLPMLVYAFVMVKYLFQQGATDVIFPLLERQLMNLSAVLPASLWLVTLIALAPVLALYAILEWQFRNSELVSAIPAM